MYTYAACSSSFVNIFFFFPASRLRCQTVILIPIYLSNSNPSVLFVLHVHTFSSNLRLIDCIHAWLDPYMLFLFQCITYSILLFCHKYFYFVTALSGAIRSSSSFRFALSSFFNNPLSCCCGFALELCSIEQFFSSSFEDDGAKVGSLVHSSYDIGTLGLRVRIFTPYGGLFSE